MQRCQRNQVAQVGQKLWRDFLGSTVTWAAVDDAMPNRGRSGVVNFLQLVDCRQQRSFVIGNRAKSVDNGIGISSADPKARRSRADIFRLTSQKETLARGAEFV